MPPTFDLLVIGDANPDVIVGPLDAPFAFSRREQLVDSGALTLGGSAAITACGAARLGLRVAFAGRVGDDGAGHYMRDRLVAHGVDVSGLHLDGGLPTPLTVIVTRGDDRAILTAPGTLATTSGRDIPARLLTSTRHLHAASYFLMPGLAADLPDLFDTARVAGATTSLDTNDDPSGRWDRAALAPVLARTDLLLPNAAEAHRLAGTDGTSVAAAAELLARQVPLVAVKNGADGALCHDGRTLLSTAGIRITPQDAVGAGDSFNAGFLAGRLTGRPIAEALDLAVACGALSTRAAGGTTAQPTWDEALTHLTANGDIPS
ncbi:carbohydrate kinase family protein [Streptomyces rugosispiralis]|uniref:Carbohydrate kinase family protein n=1 Tax=Streptomyces rugosispiralis TaxID=2967341 RepID=A0ABT1V0A6_9ACTN|nr:carbohydrate kinase family protein [Streptomyces rugosispiralis]MCQ8190453.1 carbohydrate kinase family protein [Streptomyces rugosispiralis]